MNRISSFGIARLLSLISLLLYTDALVAQSPIAKGDTVRILLVGNSFSQNTTRYLPQIAKQGGYVLILGHAELPGCPVDRHWSLAELNEKDPNDPKGRPYKGKSLKEMLQEDKWDFVTMQQYSMYSSHYGIHEPYATKLHNYIKTLCPNAKIVWHQTWAYRSDAKRFARIGENDTKTVYAKDDKQMWEGIVNSCTKVGKSLGAPIIPVGEAFWVVRNNHKWSFVKDPSYDYHNPTKGELPNDKNSLHVGYLWSKAGVFTLDPNHANQAGCYLGGLVWYGFFFGESPKSVKYVPEGVSEDFAIYLRKVATKVLKSQH